jgi:hypothetical protein
MQRFTLTRQNSDVRPRECADMAVEKAKNGE